ncbi:hypothetical protein AAEK53_001383 [Klebsiella aerogenes]|uniref:hypothetical protein n=1 Tax=Klebsiella aerogenes TaxID=548 RepID=UPI0011583733|nr:hypothetical protein [Klebsiella aerogenes]
MTIIRAVPFNFSGQMYKGIPIMPTFDDASINAFKVILGDGTEIEYESPFTVIDTTAWAAMVATAVLYGNTPVVNQFMVVDPTEVSSEIDEIKNILDEIDAVILSKLKGDGVQSININNKQLMYYSPDALTSLRAQYVKRLNELLAKAKLNAGNDPFKSITQLTIREDFYGKKTKL